MGKRGSNSKPNSGVRARDPRAVAPKPKGNDTGERSSTERASARARPGRPARSTLLRPRASTGRARVRGLDLDAILEALAPALAQLEARIVARVIAHVEEQAPASRPSGPISRRITEPYASPVIDATARVVDALRALAPVHAGEVPIAALRAALVDLPPEALDGALRGLERCYAVRLRAEAGAGITHARLDEPTPRA